MQVSEFYVEARIDSLAHKEEIIGVKLIETYSGREDGLVYRSGTYGPSLSADDAAVRSPCKHHIYCIVASFDMMLKCLLDHLLCIDVFTLAVRRWRR
jgi:hypothetical protein